MENNFAKWSDVDDKDMEEREEKKANEGKVETGSKMEPWATEDSSGHYQEEEPEEKEEKKKKEKKDEAVGKNNKREEVEVVAEESTEQDDVEKIFVKQGDVEDKDTEEQEEMKANKGKVATDDEVKVMTVEDDKVEVIKFVIDADTDNATDQKYKRCE